MYSRKAVITVFVDGQSGIVVGDHEFIVWHFRILLNVLKPAIQRESRPPEVRPRCFWIYIYIYIYIYMSGFINPHTRQFPLQSFCSLEKPQCGVFWILLKIGRDFPSKCAVFSTLLFKIKPPLILRRCPRCHTCHWCPAKWC